MNSGGSEEKDHQHESSDPRARAHPNTLQVMARREGAIASTSQEPDIYEVTISNLPIYYNYLELLSEGKREGVAETAVYNADNRWGEPKGPNVPELHRQDEPRNSDPSEA